MAVAEKPSTKKSGPSLSPTLRLAVASWVGALYLLVCFGWIFPGFPAIWDSTVGSLLGNPYLSTSLLVLVTGCMIAGLIYGGQKLLKSAPLPGVRAGSVIGAAAVFVIFLFSLMIANQLAFNSALDLTKTFDFSNSWHLVTWGSAILVGVGLTVGLGFLYLQPGFSRWLIQAEHNGWFSAAGYKANQGIKVRRGTLVGLLVIIGFGIFQAGQSKLFLALFSVDPDFASMPWAIYLPYSGDQYLFLLYQVSYTAPLLAFALLGWLSWRVINYPVFADFLIATEAEMNKVSWTTRKRLVQDTIVVLVCVVLLTVFLFVVDLLWIRLLGVPGVLQIDPGKEIAKQKESAQW